MRTVRFVIRGVLPALCCLALAFGTRAQAAPVTFQPFGNNTSQIAGFTGFDPQPGNVLNVGVQTAANNWIANGGQSSPPYGTGALSTQYTAFGQENTIVVTTTGGAMAIPAGANVKVVFGLTENVNGVTGTLGGTSSTVASNPVPTGAVNYLEIYAGGTPGNDLAGTGFNSATLILQAKFNAALPSVGNPFPQSFTVSVVSGTPVPLDQNGPNNYPNNQTVTFTGSASPVTAVITAYNPNYFVTAPTDTLIGSVIQFSSLGLADPFTIVDPSAAFLTLTTATALGGTPQTAGAGLGTASGLPTTLGLVNGGPAPPNGLGVQNAVDSSFGFNATPLATTPGTAIPEIDPSSIAGALTLLGGGLLYLTDRRRRRNAK